MSNPTIGEVWGGYQIQRQLGKGGMSTVYLARQESVGRDVAVKVLSPGLLGDETFMGRFSREVETLAKLQHPHIVPIIDYGEHAGQPFMVMAYIPGGSAQDLIAGGPLPLERCAAIIGQVAEGLDFAHERGVIHRDIKPANILIDSQGNAILTDFGIARMLSETLDLTADSVVGTLAYVSPEMVTEGAALSGASDIYGLGVTLFQMLTGKLPFNADTSPKLMWAHVYEPVPLLSEMRADLPEMVDAVVVRAMAKVPDARYASAGEMAADLQALAHGETPQVAYVEPATVSGLAALPTAPRMEDAVKRVIDQVVKIERPDGGSGSGIYLPGDRVLTNLHVVEGAAGIYVRFRSGERFEADALAADHGFDLALLGLRGSPTGISSERLNAIGHEIGELEPGELLIAIGHPLGLDWSVTGGHYNAIRQPGEDPLPRFGIELDAPLVQVDVVINSGNSGGPVIDIDGRLVGLASSMINPAYANNIGFAIAAETVWAFYEAHAGDSSPLGAYTCGHFHPAGQTYCAFTGRPAQVVPPAPMPTAEAVPYTCGHHHPPGLAYCPATGKPVTMLDTPGMGREAPPDTDRVDIKCRNCGRSFPLIEKFCPHCGKPRG